MTSHASPADPNEVDLIVRRATLALLLAVLDDECDARTHDLLCREDFPHLGVQVAHQLAHMYIRSFFDSDHEVMRADLVEDLHELAGEG